MSSYVMSPLRVTRRRWAIRVFAVLAAAMVMLTTALVDVAYAHGSTINPASRNYGCWKRWGSDFQNPAMATQDPMCWQAWQADPNAMWNWNGLYQDGVGGNYQTAVPDGTLCSGGGTSSGRYNALDTPGAWVATNLGNNFTWTMHDQARHGADFIRIYVTRQGFNPLTQRLRWSDLELRTDTGRILPGVGQTETDPVLNGVSISAQVSAPNRTGRHIVFALWQASHSDQSYYFCSDVIFPGGPTTPPTTTTPPVTPTATPTRPPTTPPVTPTTTTTRPPTTTPPTGAGTCSAAYRSVNQWPGGFQGEVTVTAGGSTIGFWTVTMTFPNGQQLSQIWNATSTTSGSVVTARSVSWNGRLGAGATTTFGFLGSWTGSNGAPTLSCSAT